MTGSLSSKSRILECYKDPFALLIDLHIINELIETERVYVEELQSIIEGYASEMENPDLIHLIPPALQNKKEVLFGNLPEIYEFHNRIFLKELENCIENPELLGRCFLKRKEDLQVYEKYCQNKLRSEALWRQCGDSLFFQECQRKLDHKLSLDAYLLKPVQRITKYQLLLKEMLKCSKNSEGTAELEEALATMLDIIKSVNDSMHQIAITGYEGDVHELGKLLMQGSFNVWTDHKKGHSKVKDLARFKPMQRHLFLYTKILLFCKKRDENTDGHEKSPSYSFKNSLKMSTVGITENVKGDNKKFEIWYNGREEVYIIQASSVELKNIWVSEIRKVLTGQLEACREASQLHQRITESVYHAPMNSSNSTRHSRKSSSMYENKSEPTNRETSNDRSRNSSPSTRQKRGWPSRQMPSLDTFEDFEAIPSSTDELSNSSDMEEEANPNNGSNLLRVEDSYETCFPGSLTLENGDLVHFVQEGENRQWLVKKLASEKSDWVSSSVFQPPEDDSNSILRKNNAEVYDTCGTALADTEMKESEVARSLTAEQRAGS